jgi:biotin transporter BioY
MEKNMNFIKKTLSSLIISGIIIFVVGVYYLMIKAGIPYQDPTPEMQLQYSVNMEVGNVLIKLGLCMTVVGSIIRIIIGRFKKRT